MTSRRAIETERRLRLAARQTFLGNPSGISNIARPLGAASGGTFVGAGAPSSGTTSGSSHNSSVSLDVSVGLIVSDQDSDPPVYVWSDDGADFIYEDI